MKAQLFLTALCVTFLSLTLASAQTGTNYSNPCIAVKKGPNTLKTKKHDTHFTNSRLNSHKRANGNGNANAYFSTKPTHYQPLYNKKHHQQPKVTVHRKSNRKKDHGDKY
jgi:hypothetical protein